jgi:hypothetical protein
LCGLRVGEGEPEGVRVGEPLGDGSCATTAGRASGAVVNTPSALTNPSTAARAIIRIIPITSTFDSFGVPPGEWYVCRRVPYALPVVR